jgi:hypothetical protein
LRIKGGSGQGDSDDSKRWQQHFARAKLDTVIGFNDEKLRNPGEPMSPREAVFSRSTSPA